MNGKEFKKFLRHLFAKMGYKIDATHSIGSTADFVLTKRNEKIVVHAKPSGDKVGIDAVRKIMVAMNLSKAPNGMIVSKNLPTPNAIILGNQIRFGWLTGMNWRR